MAEGPKLKAELGLDTKEFDKGLKGAEQATQGFGKSIGLISKAMAAAFTAGGVLAAFAAAKKVLTSAQESGDKFAATMKGLGGVAQAAAQNMATLDFSISLKDAFRAAKELEQVYDDLADRQRSLNVLSSENTLEVARLQGILRNSTVSEKERQAAAQKIKDIYAEEGRLREQAVTGAIQGELDALKTKYRISQQEAQAVLDYATNYAKFTTEQHDALNEAMTAQRKLDTYLKNNERTRDSVVKDLKEQVAITSGKVVPGLQQYVDLWRPINDYTDEHRDQVAKLLIDYNSILNTRQRELNMADRIGDRLEAQAETVAEIARTETIAPITGDFTPATMRVTGEPSSDLIFSAEKLKEITDEQISMAMELGSVFSDVFMSATQGWQAMTQTIVDSIKRIAAEILAKAAAWAILNMITGGGAGTLMNFLGLTGGGGGVSGNVLNALGSMGSANASPIQVQGIISGRDIAIINARGGSQLNGGT